MQTPIDHVQRKAIANAFSEVAGQPLSDGNIQEIMQTCENLKQVVGSITKRKEICANALDLVLKERQTLKNGQTHRWLHLTRYTRNRTFNKQGVQPIIVTVLHVTEWEEFGFAGKPAGKNS